MASKATAEKYQLDHWSDDRGASIIAASGILMFATTTAVALRLWAQRLIKSRFEIDDYLIITSLVLCLGICANTIICVHYGIGQHLLRVVKTDTNPPDKAVNLFKAIFVEGFLWAIAIPMVKIAILLFYRRIFTGNQRWFKWVFWIVLLYCILWFIATFVVVMLQCLPVPFFWTRAYAFYEMTPPEKGTCLQTRASQVPSALSNCVGDLVLLLLPFPVLVRLQMNIRRKLELMFIFGLGTFVLAASIVRLRFIWLDENSADPTWDDAETLVWTPVECCVGVICACIPCMAPLRRFLSGGAAKAGEKVTRSSRMKGLTLTGSHRWPRDRSLFNSNHASKDSDNGESGEDISTFEMHPTNAGVLGLGAEDKPDPLHWRSVEVKGASESPAVVGDADDVPDNRIMVSNNLEWAEEAREKFIC